MGKRLGSILILTLCMTAFNLEPGATKIIFRGPQPVTELSGENNEFGGKSYTTAKFGEKYRFQFQRSHDKYIITDGETFELGGIDYRYKNLEIERIEHRYDGAGYLRSERIVYLPGCLLHDEYGISEETNWYPVEDNLKATKPDPMNVYRHRKGMSDFYRLPVPIRKTVRFTDTCREKTGRQSGEYWFDYSARGWIDRDMLRKTGFAITYDNYSGHGFSIVRYMEVVSPELTARTGLVSREIFPTDGTRTRVNYHYREIPAGGIITARFFQPPRHRPTHGHRTFYNYSGDEITVPGNSWGGKTVEAHYLPLDPARETRGIHTARYEYTTAGILRVATFEGSELDNRLNFHRSTNSTGCYRAIDRFNEQGNPLSEETFHHPQKNHRYFSRMIKTYLKDGGVAITWEQPDGTPVDDQKDLTLRQDRHGKILERSWIPPALEARTSGADRMVVSFGHPPVHDVSFSTSPPWEAALQKVSYQSIITFSRYQGDRLVSRTSEASGDSVASFDRIAHRVRHTPMAFTLDLPRLARYLEEGLTAEIEKAYAAFYWTSYGMKYVLDTYKENKGIRTGNNGFLVAMQGACGTYSMICQTLMELMGLEVMYGAGGCVTDPQSHAWNIVRIDGVYYPLDPTWKRFIEHPLKFMDDHWPAFREQQCVYPPYQTYDDYKRKNGIKQGRLDHYMRSECHEYYQTLLPAPYLKEVEVLKNGIWRPAMVVEIRKGLHLIHYSRSVYEMDEWVTPDRVRQLPHRISPPGWR